MFNHKIDNDNLYYICPLYIVQFFDSGSFDFEKCSNAYQSRILIFANLFLQVLKNWTDLIWK